MAHQRPPALLGSPQDEAEAAAFVGNDPYAKAGLFRSSVVTQLAELDVTGQHLDRQWEKFQLEGACLVCERWVHGSSTLWVHPFMDPLML